MIGSSRSRQMIVFSRVFTVGTDQKSSWGIYPAVNGALVADSSRIVGDQEVGIDTPRVELSAVGMNST